MNNLGFQQLYMAQTKKDVDVVNVGETSTEFFITNEDRKAREWLCLG